MGRSLTVAARDGFSAPGSLRVAARDAFSTPGLTVFGIPQGVLVRLIEVSANSSWKSVLARDCADWPAGRVDSFDGAVEKTDTGGWPFHVHHIAALPEFLARFADFEKTAVFGTQIASGEVLSSVRLRQWRLVCH